MKPSIAIAFIALYMAGFVTGLTFPKHKEIEYPLSIMRCPPPDACQLIMWDIDKNKPVDIRSVDAKSE